jgi:hypothetical protein
VNLKDKDVDELAESVGKLVEKILKLVLVGDEKPAKKDKKTKGAQD